MCATHIDKRDKLQAPSEEEVAEWGFHQMNYLKTLEEGKWSHLGEVKLQQRISYKGPLITLHSQIMAT